MERWVKEIEGVNEWLKGELWPRGEGGKLRRGRPEGDAEGVGEEGGAGMEGEQEWIPEGGEWVVGEGKGLDLRKGVLWYGGGETVRLGKGF